MGSTVMEPDKDGSKKTPKKRRGLRIDMPVELHISSSCPTKGIFLRSNSASPSSGPSSGPVLTKVPPPPEPQWYVPVVAQPLGS
ncbi:hypothetical protein NHX12_004098 [Muraenolepis orangiensis]|uniref:Uncharacterized protein n=1 Tax=Muraenolepis orangiensis TaxID=630683 RepID=A0A9Q0IBV1_9TELE|nr:hypothetical protein NHX12_004098 [Muraenolepis orangiensis]